MPLKDLVGGMNDVPAKEASIAAGLPYRDYRTLAVSSDAIKVFDGIEPCDKSVDIGIGIKISRISFFNRFRMSIYHILGAVYKPHLDHSMCTSFEAVHNILNGISDRSNIWNVNTEKEYHEAKA